MILLYGDCFAVVKDAFNLLLCGHFITYDGSVRFADAICTRVILASIELLFDLKHILIPLRVWKLSRSHILLLLFLHDL